MINGNPTAAVHVLSRTPSQVKLGDPSDNPQLNDLRQEFYGTTRQHGGAAIADLRNQYKTSLKKLNQKEREYLFAAAEFGAARHDAAKNSEPLPNHLSNLESFKNSKKLKNQISAYLTPLKGLPQRLSNLGPLKNFKKETGSVSGNPQPLIENTLSTSSASSSSSTSSSSSSSSASSEAPDPSLKALFGTLSGTPFDLPEVCKQILAYLNKEDLKSLSQTSKAAHTALYLAPFIKLFGGRIPALGQPGLPLTTAVKHITPYLNSYYYTDIFRTENTLQDIAQELSPLLIEAKNNGNFELVSKLVRKILTEIVKARYIKNLSLDKCVSEMVFEVVRLGRLDVAQTLYRAMSLPGDWRQLAWCGGRTLFNAAAQGNHLGIMQDMVKIHGLTSPNVADPDGTTPAHYAAENGNLAMMEWLATQPGFDINAKNNDSDTIAHVAAIFGHVEVLKWLRENTNLDFAIQNNYGKTAEQLLRRRVKM